MIKNLIRLLSFYIILISLDLVEAKSLASNVVGQSENYLNDIKTSIAFLDFWNEVSSWSCSGSLISQNYVLTSATCAKEASKVFITLAKSEKSQIRVESTEIIIPDNFDSENITNDIAFIKLPEAVTFTDNIQAVLLPQQTDDFEKFLGNFAITTAWISRTRNNSILSDIPNYYQLKIITNKECKKYFNITDKQMCTISYDKFGACVGDSGSPLVVNGIQIGILSYGGSFCNSGYPTVYTNITSYLPLIDAVTGLNSQ